LNDAERMFFVSLLLNHTLGWVRAQSGTTSLRAILYMDEIFGYFPPVANPPSKAPLLTLLKQARAFGLGGGAGHAKFPSIWITKDWPIPARGLSAVCKQSVTKHG
jgi:hypothetical protein